MFTSTKVKEEADSLSADKSEKARKGLRNISYLPVDVYLPEKCFLCTKN